jgi:hypothetical protein
MFAIIVRISYNTIHLKNKNVTDFPYSDTSVEDIRYCAYATSGRSDRFLSDKSTTHFF